MPADSNDPNLRAAAKRCVEITYRYLRWMQEEVEVQPGSDIDVDDRAFSVVSMQELLDGPIKAALDCLLLVTWTLDQNGHPRAHGHSAAIRAALTAATTALWVMVADTDLRRERALTIAYAQAEAESLHVRDARPDWRGSGSGMGDFINSRNQRGQQILANAEAIGLDPQKVKAKPKDQNIIRQGGARVTPGTLPTNDPGAYVLAEWRILSGLAHGFHWPIKYASPGTPNPDDERFTTYTVDLSLDLALGKVRTALIVTRAAMDRWAALAGIAPVDNHGTPFPAGV